MKRLTIKMFTEAYAIMAKRGWVATSGTFCNKQDKKVCPVAALAFSLLKRMPSSAKLASYDEIGAVEKRFGVSWGYLWGIVFGVDIPKDTVRGNSEASEGKRLGKKLYHKFIAPCK